MTTPATPSANSPNRLIRASAGTGKTFQLANQYIARLRATPHPERIFASTFTRKAAAEILERILKTLAEAALDPDKLKLLSQHLGSEPLTQEECLDLLARMTRNLHRVRISTLDSFFSQLARSFSLELGLPPGWRIIDPLEETQLRTVALEQFLSTQPQADIVRLMHLLEKGDAGRRVTSLLHDAVTTFYGVFRESTPAAWQQLPQPPLTPKEELERVDDFLNVFGAKLREDQPKWKNWHAAIDAVLGILRDGRWHEFIGITLAQKVHYQEEKYDRRPIPDDVREAVDVLLRHATAMVLREMAGQLHGTWDLLDRFHRVLADRLEEARASTFSEVTLALARRNETLRPELVEYRLDAGIEHLLLDEFQDTSLMQWAVIRPLARRVIGMEGGSFFCVGDPKQSIYRWRGGAPALFDTLAGDLGSLGEDSLTRSFRSSQAVIDCVNAIFRGIGRHTNLGEAEPVVQSWVKRFPEHSTRWSDAERAGYVTLEASGADEEFHDFLVRRVRDLHTEAPRASIGILVRENNTVAAVARTLRLHGIPASEEGGNTPIDCLAVRLILTLLHLADHPGDSAAAFAIAHSPLGPVLNLTQDSADEEIDRLAAALRRQLAEEGYGRCIDRWARVLAPVCDPRGVARLRQLVDLAFSYDADATLRPGDFVELVENRKLEQPSTAPIRVMTIHQAKGLQFDIVVLAELDIPLVKKTPSYVTGAESPVVPPQTIVHYCNKETQSLLPEELQKIFRASREAVFDEAMCVLYVALTRGIHALHMLVSPTPGNEKTLKLTQANLIRAALLDGAPIQPSSVPYRHGDPNWLVRTPHLQARPDQEAQSVQSKSSAEPLTIRLAPAASDRLKAAERITPSGKKTKSGVPLSQFLRPGDSFALSRGSLIHAWLERITWREESPLSDSELRRIALPLGVPDHLLATAIREFREMLQSGETAALLSRDAAGNPANLPFPPAIVRDLTAGPVEPVVRNERRFLVPDGGQVISGSIDRLVLYCRDGRALAADIIDYKTDGLDGLSAKETASRREHYHEQLRLYCRAVSILYDLPPERIAARLVMLGSGTIDRLQPARPPAKRRK